MDHCENVSVVLPAAGTGERLGNQKPKQYCFILGKPLICYAIEGYERFSWVKRLVVVAAPEYMELMTEIVEDYGYSRCEVVCGGSTRHRSIAAGIKALSYLDSNSEVVVIHDGVRPVVPEEIVKAVVVAAKQYGACGAVRPLVSTVVSIDDNGFLKQSLERSVHKASEMPQAFQYNVIKMAYEKCTEHDLDHGTECLQLALKYVGVKAKLLESSVDLWKVTHKRDMHTAEATFKELSNHILIVSDNIQCSLIETMQKTLNKKFPKVDVCDSKIREPDDYADYNNTVFVHFDKLIENLVKSNIKLEEASDKTELLCASEIRGVIIHILAYTKEPVPTIHNYPEAFIAVKAIAEHCTKPFTSVHVIWNIKFSSEEKIANLVLEMVCNRNTMLHGQLFVV